MHMSMYDHHYNGKQGLAPEPISRDLTDYLALAENTAVSWMFQVYW